MDLPLIHLTPQESLLINLCRLSFSAEQKALIEKDISGVSNWASWIIKVNSHGIAALVYSNLRELGFIDRLPAEQQDFLKTAYFKSLGRNTGLQDRFREISELLAEEGITPVLIKGMALELTVYGNLGLRQMNDIDILVEPGRAMRAWELLQENNYVARPFKSSLHKYIMPYHGKHLPDLYKDGISVDLHHRLIDKFSAEDIQLTETEAGKISVPVRNIHFLYLVRHLHGHELNGESQLRLYCDLCQLMLQCRDITGFEKIRELAEKNALLKQLLEKIYILQVFWKIPLPPEITADLGAPEKEECLLRFMEFIHQPKGRKARQKGRQYREALSKIPGFHRKLLFLAGDIFPSVEFMQRRYKTSTRTGAAVRYPLRLAKLVLLIIK